MKFQKTFCPTPQKKSYSSEKNALWELEKHCLLNNKPNLIDTIKVYKCVCGDWHWSSKK